MAYRQRAHIVAQCSAGASMAVEGLETPIETPIESFIKYFKQRGITPEVIDKNKITLTTLRELAVLTPRISAAGGQDGFAALIPFYGIDGGDMSYHVARILELEQRAGSFSAQMGMSSTKLVCPSGPTRAYFPRNNPELVEGMTCVVTESAVKAIVAANCGFFAVGLNGCWGFSGKSTGDKMLPDLMRMPWKSFSDILYVPDSDVATNPNVSAAAGRFVSFVQQLFRLEAKVVQIPYDDEKLGLDDYYVRVGRDQLIKTLTSNFIVPDLSNFMQAMVELNNNTSYIVGANLFALHDINILAKEQHFHNYYATTSYTVEDKIKPASKAWITWPGRQEIAKVVNLPGAPISDNETFYNLWRPSDVTPRKGDITVHLDFLKRAIPSATERQYIMEWVAHLMQKPHIKKSTALVLYSGEQGTGKTMLATTIGRMVGRHNTAEVSMDVFKSSFNSSYVGKQVVIINETSANEKLTANSMVDKLKTLITETTHQLHAKGKDALDVDNYSCFVLTTNHLDSLKLDPTDRRFAVFEFMSQFRYSKEAEQLGEACWRWHEEHIPELVDFYANYGVEQYSPHAPAIQTIAKQALAEGSYTENETIAANFKADKEEMLAALNLPRSLKYVTSEIVLRAHSPYELRDPLSKAIRFSQSMKKFGFENVKFNFIINGQRKTVKMWNLEPDGDHDPAKAKQDFLTGSGGKTSGVAPE